MAWGRAKPSAAHGDWPCPPTYTHLLYLHLFSRCPGSSFMLRTCLSQLCPNPLQPANAGQEPTGEFFIKPYSALQSAC